MIDTSMKVRAITIEGENVILPAAQFDWLSEQARRVAVLENVAARARAVISWDWSTNDEEPVADICALADALKRVTP
jgi:hypothetical protein